MPVAARPPLPVEVVTKIPVQTGIGITNPATTGAITRSVGAQAVSNAARTAEVVTNVPSGLRNITPVSFGQKLASFGQGVVNFGGKVGGFFSGVSAGTVALATGVILATDAALFASPVGRGSDMVGGVKLGSPTIAKPQATATSPRPIAKPQTTTAPKPQPVTQPQIQTQPLPFFPTTPPQPTRSQPQPISMLPRRAALETPTPQPSKSPITTQSPYPLNFVDIFSYGGVNLAYPIAQKLVELSSFLQPNLEQLQLELQDLPQKFQDILRNAKIETNIELPAKFELFSQLPMQLDLSKEVPVAVDFKSELPINLDINSQLPVTTNLSSQLPLNIDLIKEVPIAVDLRKEIPISADLISQLPLNIDLNSQVPLGVNLIKEIPIAIDLRKEIPLNIGLESVLPVNLDIDSQLPINIDLRKEVPFALDLSAILQPDTKASGLKSLQKCCEDIQNTLKKKEEMFEGIGNLVCNGQTVPYSYRGAGLNGIHQLIKIVLDANGQILEKICTLDATDTQNPQPLIQGSGVYTCGNGTSPPIFYNYSGVGLLGIQNQIDQLFNLDKKILTEVCEIGSSPFGSMPFPEISGQIEYFDCDLGTQSILYSGNGLEGLSNQINALTNVVAAGVKASCESGKPVVIMPDARFEQFKPTGQLAITLGTNYPSQQGSLWHIYLPNPLGELNWCEHFERIKLTKGNIYARLEWANSKIPTGAYFESEEEAIRILRYLVTLSTATPTFNELGQPKILIQKGNSSKRNIQVRTLRAIRAVSSIFGADGEVATLKCYTPPPEGCLPTII